MSISETRKIEERSEFELPDFWGHRAGEQTIDATMLRTVDWCGVGGFDQWWKRLARRTTADFIEGGIEPGSLVYWLFAMSRSRLATKIMPQALQLALGNIELVRTRLHPWTHREPDAQRQLGVNEYAYKEFEDIAHAAAIVFANYSVRPSNERNAELLDAAAGVLQKYQHTDGSWPYGSQDKDSSVEATAMAVHALALHQPVGWKRNVERAVAMLTGSQQEGGYWAEDSCPDAPYLTVLVLDALELAKGGKLLTLGPLPDGYIPEPTDPTEKTEILKNYDAGRESISEIVKNPQGKKTLLTSQVVNYFEVSARTIYRWVARGQLNWEGRRGSITIESIQQLESKRSRKRSAS